MELKPQTQKHSFLFTWTLNQEEMRKSDHQPKAKGYYTSVLNILSFRESLLLGVKPQISNTQLFQNLFRSPLKREALVLKVNTHPKVDDKHLKGTSCVFGIT